MEEEVEGFGFAPSEDSRCCWRRSEACMRSEEGSEADM
jgi:hypothetical protein